MDAAIYIYLIVLTFSRPHRTQCNTWSRLFPERNNVPHVSTIAAHVPDRSIHKPDKYNRTLLVTPADWVHAAFGRLRLSVVAGTASTVMHFAQRITGGILEAHRSHTH